MRESLGADSLCRVDQLYLHSILSLRLTSGVIWSYYGLDESTNKLEEVN